MARKNVRTFARVELHVIVGWIMGGSLSEARAGYVSRLFADTALVRRTTLFTNASCGTCDVVAHATTLNCARGRILCSPQDSQRVDRIQFQFATPRLRVEVRADIGLCLYTTCSLPKQKPRYHTSRGGELHVEQRRTSRAVNKACELTTNRVAAGVASLSPSRALSTCWAREQGQPGRPPRPQRRVLPSGLARLVNTPERREQMHAPDISAERRELCESQAALGLGVCTGSGSGGGGGLHT